MTEPARSVPDVAEQLMHEFGSFFPVSTVTEIVIRLSRNGSTSLSALAEMAREELSVLVTEPASEAADQAEAVSP